MKKVIKISKLENDAQIHQVVELAKPLWLEHYSEMIGEKQVLYMLEKFQTFEAIKIQLVEQYQYFLVASNKELMGYFSIQHRENSSLFISKFYLSKKMRGYGTGKLMLTYIEKLAIKNFCNKIDLTVNKNNPALNAYLKLGFTNKGSTQFDIGGGFIMDDYLMTKTLI